MTARRAQARKKAPSRKPATHRNPADEHAATELVLFIENTSDLSPDGPRGQGHDVLLNALRKWKKGTYDPELAVRLFQYLADAGAKRYEKEFGSDSPIFNPATRHEAARQLEAAFRSSVESGEYDHVDTRIGLHANKMRRSEPQRRWGPCPFCGATGWTTSAWRWGNPLYHHDRPQGGKCLQALQAENRGQNERPHRATQTAEAKNGLSHNRVMTIAEDLSKRLRGTFPKSVIVSGEPGARFSTYSPGGQSVVVFLSTVDDDNIALDIYTDESTRHRYESISTFLYGPDGYTSKRISVRDMVDTVEWVWNTVDSYYAEGEEVEESPQPKRPVRRRKPR